MKKYKIINPDEKFCGECGKKTNKIPSKYFDEKTGLKEAKLECRKKHCNEGQKNIKDKKFYEQWDKELNCSVDHANYQSLFQGIFGIRNNCHKCGAFTGVSMTNH